MRLFKDIKPSQRKWRKYDFGGPAFNLVIMMALPLIVYYLYFAVHFNNGMPLPIENISFGPFNSFCQSIMPSWTAVALYLSWFSFQALLQALLPGKISQGKALKDGSHLSYKLNGLLSFIITLGTIAILIYFNIIDTAIIYNNLGALISVVMIFSLLMSIFLYFYGKKRSPDSERSGNIIHDFFMGSSLNPRIGSFDLKFFCEARPGLILWILINASYMGLQYKLHGTVTTAMILVNIMQFWYILDYYLHEETILTTMDIAYENFGFMLTFGDLAWVPFTYSLQALFLVNHLHHIPLWGAGLILLINIGGYFIFRQVNLQKHNFTFDAEKPIWGKKPEFIKTQRGTRLLASGFWSWSRHFNYVGDILMATAWSLPTLFFTPVTYFYPIYFAVLLIHRERRDNKHCAIKYGEDWDRYCEKVPSRIIPKIY